TIDKMNQLFQLLHNNTTEHSNITQAAQSEESIRTLYLAESANRSKYRAQRLLRRAQSMLSEHSTDKPEIEMKIDVFESLFCNKKDSFVLSCRENVHFPF